jgi:hypothetical protein
MEWLARGDDLSHIFVIRIFEGDHLPSRNFAKLMTDPTRITAPVVDAKAISCTPSPVVCLRRYDPGANVVNAPCVQLSRVGAK